MPQWLLVFIIAAFIYFAINVVIAAMYMLAVLSGSPPDKAEFVRRDIKKMFFFGLPWLVWVAARETMSSSRLIRLLELLPFLQPRLKR